MWEFDIALLEDIHKRWFENKKEIQDLNSFIRGALPRTMLVKDPRRKIIVFSEFADNVNHLYEKLKIKT